MFRCVTLFFLFTSSFLQAQSTDPFDRARLEFFYSRFVCLQKNIDANAGISGRCTRNQRNRGQIVPPPVYPAITLPNLTITTYFPLVIINDTGLPDSEVYFTMFGNKATICGVQGESVVLDFSSSPYATYQPTSGFPTKTYIPGYSYPLSGVAKTTDSVSGSQYSVIYIPAMNNSELLFSLRNALQPYSNATSNLTIPQYTNINDPNYNTVFQALECTFYPDCPLGPTPQFTMDVTCVDSYGFSIALQAFQTPIASTGPSTGIYQSRAFMLTEFDNTFASNYGLSSQQNWDTLILRDGSKVLRVVSPGYSSSNSDKPQGAHFDVNYWDHATEYGYSWANNVWKTLTGFYSPPNTFTVTTSTGNTYVGAVQIVPAYTLGAPSSFYSHAASPGFIFTLQGTGTNIGADTKFYIPWVNSASEYNAPNIVAPYPGFNTSTALFETATIFPGMAYSTGPSGTILKIPSSSTDNTTIDATVLTQIFGGAIVAGLIPGVVSSLAFTPGPTPEQVALYYLPNGNLTSPGSITGPWHDLYSKAILGDYLHTGNAAYAYAYDDYLYSNPSVLKVTAQVPFRNTTNPNISYCIVRLGPYSDN